jgi:hypothetical protein
MLALEQTRWHKNSCGKIFRLNLRQLRYQLQKLEIE